MFSSIGASYIDVPRVVIESDGNVGIDTADPQAKLNVDGTVMLVDTIPQIGLVMKWRCSYKRV